MKSFSRFLTFILVGALAGAAVSSWLAPQAIAWYFDPPVDMGINCKAATEWSMARLLWSQLLGGALGVVCSVAVFVALRPRSKVSQ